MGLLNKFSIPYIAVYDIDHQVGKSPDAINSADIDSAAIENVVDTNFGHTISLVNDIEEELGITQGSSGKPYAALEEVSAEGFTLAQQFVDKVISMYE